MRILIPSDFSTVADDAFHAACLIGVKQKAEIHLFHAADMPQEWAKLSFSDGLRKQISETILSNAKKEFDLRAKKAIKMGLAVSFHYSEGAFLDKLKEVSKEIDFDLVVIGSHGASGKKEWFLGSKTQKAIRYLHKTVLVVKNPVVNIDFSKILFASGLFEEDQKAFKQLLDFVKIYDVKEIHVLAIETGGLFSPPKVVMLEALKDFKAIAHEYNCQTHLHSALSIESGIRNFIKDKDIQLVALSNYVKHPLKRILAGSNVEMVVNHVEVPVLSIDY